MRIALRTLDNQAEKMLRDWSPSGTMPSLCVPEAWTLGRWGFLKVTQWDFPSGPVVKASLSNAWGVGSIPGWEAKVLLALRPKKLKHKTEAILQQIQ